MGALTPWHLIVLALVLLLIAALIGGLVWLAVRAAKKSNRR